MKPSTTSYPTEGVIKAPAVYPPVIESAKVLGYVMDRNGIGYSRDIGRSFTFGGRCYYIFGDTFCKNQQGDFVGLQSNTAALVESPAEPLNSAYLSIQEDGMVDALIPLTGDEHCLGKGEEMRVTLWAFGGLVEVSPGLGYIWYEKGEEHEQGGSKECGVGLARVTSDLTSGQLYTVRYNNLMFDVNEPRVGTFSTILHEGFIYLWGHHGSDVILARVPRDSPWRRDMYTFWDGKGYVPWWQAAVPVLKDVQHGAIVNSSLFGNDRPWVFIGCTKWADSKVMIGASAHLEGPWELTPVWQATGIDYPKEYMYCMYPHQWAFAEEDGELMVTWSEAWPGNVVAAKLRFQQERNPIYWKRVSVNEYSHNARCELMRNDAASIAAYSGVKISQEGRWTAPGFAAPAGIMPLHVRIEGSDKESVIEGASLVKAQLANKTKFQRAPQDISLTPPVSPTTSPTESRAPRHNSFSRAFDRIFRRSGSSGSTPLISSPGHET